MLEFVSVSIVWRLSSNSSSFFDPCRLSRLALLAFSSYVENAVQIAFLWLDQVLVFDEVWHARVDDLVLSNRHDAVPSLSQVLEQKRSNTSSAVLTPSLTIQISKNDRNSSKIASKSLKSHKNRFELATFSISAHIKAMFGTNVDIWCSWRFKSAINMSIYCQ